MVQASSRGNRSSWIVVAVMIVAFGVAGLGLVLGNWWIVGIGAAVFVIAGIVGLATGIMEQVH